MNKFADKIHVLFRKEDIDPSKMEGKIVVVLDILFATTTIVSALNNGINSVVPAFNAQDAREKKDESSANKILLAGVRAGIL
jgi:2-phosphosulfolactate phosphatase